MKILSISLASAALLSSAVFATDLASLVSKPAVPQDYQSINNPNPTLAAAPATVISGPQSSLGSQQAVTSLAQDTLTFEQQASQRIQALEASNHAMGAAIQQLAQNISDMQTILAQTKAQPETTSMLGLFKNPEIEGLILGGGAIFLLAMGFLVGASLRSRRPAKEDSASSPKKVQIESPEEEYDFMNTAQAIPAKLNLARSYIAMNDFVQAKAILKTVLVSGDDLQKREARALFETCEVQ